MVSLTQQHFPDDFLDLLNTVTGKRARIVVEHILEHGFITTEDLENQYGYSHPPRAVRDVREQGIPIETFAVKNAQGRTIAAYRFGDPSQALTGRQGGRRIFPKTLKTTLYDLQNGKCAVCSEAYDERYLQIDHRIPYQVAGEPDEIDKLESFMLLCSSCNRAKSWSCEHCENALHRKEVALCLSCYWANPHEYTHIALQPIRRVELIWSGDSVDDYEILRQLAEAENESLPEYVKNVLRSYLRSRKL